MIYYSALAESSALILTIYFITSGIFLNNDKRKTRLTAYHNYFTLNFFLFILSITTAIAGLWYSIVIFIISAVFLGFSIDKLFKMLMKEIPN
jgi:hypothetical protein